MRHVDHLSLHLHTLDPLRAGVVVVQSRLQRALKFAEGLDQPDSGGLDSPVCAATETTDTAQTGDVVLVGLVLARHRVQL